MRVSDIAQHQNVHSTTVLRYLHSLKPDVALFDQFKETRADTLGLLHAKALRNEHQIQDWVHGKLNDEGFTNTAKPHHIKALNDMAVFTAWKSYEAERLAGGQSTQNVSFLSKVILASDQIPSKPLEEKQASIGVESASSGPNQAQKGPSKQ